MISKYLETLLQGLWDNFISKFWLKVWELLKSLVLRCVEKNERWRCTSYVVAYVQAVSVSLVFRLVEASHAVFFFALPTSIAWLASTHLSTSDEGETLYSQYLRELYGYALRPCIACEKHSTLALVFYTTYNNISFDNET